MRLFQQIIIFGLIFIIGLAIGVIGSVIITKHSRRNIGQIYWKTVSQSRKLSDASAIEILKKFIKKYPASEYVEDAFYTICKIKFKASVKSNQNWHKPIQGYLDLLSNYPESKYLEPISFSIPFCYAKNKDYVQAIKKFKEFLKIFPKSDLADEAQYNIGRLYWACGKFQEAKKAYKLVAKNYSNDDLIDEALFRIGEVYLAQGNYRQAISKFKQVIKRFPQIALYAQAMIGFCLYLDRNFKEAKDTYLQVLSNYPNNSLKNEIWEFVNGMFLENAVQNPVNEDLKTYFLCTDKGIVYPKKNLLFLINFNQEELNKMQIFPFNTNMFFSPIRDEFIVGSGDYLWKVSINGRQKIKIAKQQDTKVNIHWSPDGKNIIYETQKTLYLIQLNGNKLIKLLEKSSDTASFSPTWSYDSTKIACLNWSEDGNFADLIIFDSNGNREKIIKKIFGKNIYFSGFNWSYDNQKITYAISRKWRKGIVEEIRVVDLPRSIVTTVIYDSAEQICWSPDSSKIAYSNYRGTLVINANGKNWQYLSNIRMGSLQWNSNQTLCGIGRREEYFVYRILNLNRQTKKFTIKGNNPLISNDGKLIAYNDDKGRLAVEDINTQTKRILSCSKIIPLKWLANNSKIICFDSNNYFLIDRYKKQQIYQGTPKILLTSFKNLTFSPKSYDDNSILGNLDGNIVRIRDNIKYLLTLKGGKNPVLSPNKEDIVYEKANNLWMMKTDGTHKFQLTLQGGSQPHWFKNKIIFEQPKRTTLNWWDFDLKVNQKIHQEKGKIAQQYLLELIQPFDSDENISIINDDGTNCRKLIKSGTKPDISPDGKIAFERQGMIWVKDINGEKAMKLVKGTSPKWSCDGKILAYLKGDNLWIIEEKEKKIKESIEYFAWLPAKNKIAYSQNGALFIKDVYTDEVIQLTKSLPTGS